MNRSELDALKARIDLVEAIRSCGVALKRSGKSWTGRCPLHPDDKPSLSVSPEEQLWQCFGCKEGGDVFRFFERVEQLDFPMAVERARVFAGEPAPSNGRKRVKPPARPAEPALLERVAQLYRQALVHSREAQDYLERRGLGDPELWEAFAIGCADGSLRAVLPSEGATLEQLEMLGVVSSVGKELMRGCIVVPLTHPSGETLGLYGRAHRQESEVPHRYLRGPKRGVLNWQAVRSSERLVIAESVLDALSLWRAGVREVSCLYGAGDLPQDLEVLLERGPVREVVWCLDADAAGREATVKLAARVAGMRKTSLRVELPEGFDPNRVLVELGAEKLAALVGAAVPVEGPVRRVRTVSEPATRPAVVASPEVVPAAPSEPEKALELEEDRFRLTLDQVAYEVCPLGPFHGRLRALLRAEHQAKRFATRLDFLMSRALSQEAAQLAQRLELDKATAEAHLQRLQLEAERWVAERHPARPVQPVPAARPAMSAEEREEALAFLLSPDLAERILRDMDELGFVGEENPKLLAYLIGISRRLEEPLAGIVISQSSAGKSGLTDIIEQLTPEEEVVLYSRITAQAISNHEKDALKRKLLMLAEKAGGGESADYQIRELLSRHKFKTLVPEKDPATGQIQSRLKEVEGPVAYLETTANPNINHENATRCFEIELDESEEQTRRIHEAQKARYRLSSRLGADHLAATRRRHHNAQRLLELRAVLIPFVDHIRFPARWVRTRRDHKRFLCLVEASAFLHQFQRQQGQLPDGTRYVEATLADYRLAWRLARDVLRSTFHELSRGARDLWEVLLPWVLGQAGKGRAQEVLFTRKSARQLVSWPRHRLDEAMQELVDMEYLFVASGSQGKAFQYTVLVDQPLGSCAFPDLTPPEELERLGVA